MALSIIKKITTEDQEKLESLAKKRGYVDYEAWELAASYDESQPTYDRTGVLKDWLRCIRRISGNNRVDSIGWGNFGISCK